MVQSLHLYGAGAWSLGILYTVLVMAESGAILDVTFYPQIIELEPQFNSSVLSYSVYVPESISEASMHYNPAVLASHWVYNLDCSFDFNDLRWVCPFETQMLPFDIYIRIYADEALGYDAKDYIFHILVKPSGSATSISMSYVGTADYQSSSTGSILTSSDEPVSISSTKTYSGNQATSSNSVLPVTSSTLLNKNGLIDCVFTSKNAAKNETKLTFSPSFFPPTIFNYSVFTLADSDTLDILVILDTTLVNGALCVATLLFHTDIPGEILQTANLLFLKDTFSPINQLHYVVPVALLQDMTMALGATLTQFTVEISLVAKTPGSSTLYSVVIIIPDMFQRKPFKVDSSINFYQVQPALDILSFKVNNEPTNYTMNSILIVTDLDYHFNISVTSVYPPAQIISVCWILYLSVAGLTTFPVIVLPSNEFTQLSDGTPETIPNPYKHVEYYANNQTSPQDWGFINDSAIDVLLITKPLTISLCYNISHPENNMMYTIDFPSIASLKFHFYNATSDMNYTFNANFRMSLNVTSNLMQHFEVRSPLGVTIVSLMILLAITAFVLQIYRSHNRLKSGFRVSLDLDRRMVIVLIGITILTFLMLVIK